MNILRAFSIGCVLFSSLAPSAIAADLPLDKLKLPEGFRVEVYATGVPNARQMALGAKGTLFVGSREKGAVYAVVDTNGDKRADEVLTLASGLTMPSGVAFRDGALYVAAISSILRFDAIEDNLRKPPKPAVVVDDLPKDEHHGWKFIAFGPDGQLYVPVGAPCNVCERPEPYATILRMKPDGSGRTVVARGVRNSVGFDWNPGSRELWFTDNGRDLLGDDVPPDELNRVENAGDHFGFPHCHGGTIADPELGRDCSKFRPPARALGPHVAAIGMRFYTGSMFPAQYRNQIFIAEHGSWNRSKKSGYRVTVVKVDGGKVVSYEPFAEGWLQGQEEWGRPADVLPLPDGSLLVSDDSANVIYRITYSKGR
jgi:glucose/arabinose dehydrogenase